MTAFFILSKLAWMVLRPSNLVLILALWGLLRRARGHKGRALVLAGLGYVLAASPLGGLPLAYLESRFPACDFTTMDVDAIAVLGGTVDTSLSNQHGMLAIEDAGERLLTLAQLTQAGLDAPLVFSGGSLALDGKLSEAALVRAWLQDLKLPVSQVQFDEKALNTYQNAVNIRALLPAGTARVAVVTSAFHMPRSVGIFRQQGFEVTACPVDFRSDFVETLGYFSASQQLEAFDLAAREAVGLVVYYVSGRSAALLPVSAVP